MKIAPSILNSDLTRIAESLRLLEQSNVDFVHLDVMDGMFVPNISIGIPVIASINAATDLPLDVHLMIEQPERYVTQFIDAGADILTIHYEATRHPFRALQAIRDAGARAGVAINPGTPVNQLIDVLEIVDLVLIMSVNPGFGGQKFIEGAFKRVAALRQLMGQIGSSALIEVDGGVTSANSRQLIAAGADVLVAGTAIFADPDGVVAGVERIRRGD